MAVVAGFADQAFGFFEMRAGLGAVAAGEGATGRGEVAVGEVESRAAMRKTPAGREACRISRERKGNSKSARFGGRMHHLAGRLPIGGTGCHPVPHKRAANCSSVRKPTHTCHFDGRCFC